MTVIGELWVAVRPDTTGFNTSLKSKLEAAVGTSGGGIASALSKVGAGVTAGLAIASVASVKLASDFQEATASIAVSANIPIAAAQKIGAAFLDTQGTSIFSATQLAGAYALVAGQLGYLNGKALDAKQSIAFMQVAQDLAEASGENLNNTTQDLANTMKAFEIPLKGASAAGNELFSTSRIIGVSMDDLTNVVTRLESRLGVAAPTLTDMNTLLVDLNAHSVSGARGLLVINTALTTLIKGATSVPADIAKAVNSAQNSVTSSGQSLTDANLRLQQAQQKLQAAGAPTLAQTQALAAAQQAVAQAQQNVTYSTGASLGPANALATAQTRLKDIQAQIAADATPTLSNNQALQSAQLAVANATANHTKAVEALQLAQKGLSPTLATATQEAAQLGIHIFTAKGQFEGFGNVIAQLQPKIKDMTRQQQLNAVSSLFGESAGKALLKVVLAGPAAWDKAQKAVTAANAAHLAAEKQATTLRRQLDLVKATITDLAIRFGDLLIPKLEDVGHVLAIVTNYLVKHKDVATGVAIVIGGFLTTAVATFAVNMTTKFVGSVLKAVQSLGLMGRESKNVANVVTDSTEKQIIDLKDLDEQLVLLGAHFDKVGESITEVFAPITELTFKTEQLGFALTTVSDKTAAYTDAAGRWRNAAGQFVSASDAVQLNLNEEWETAQKLPPAYDEVSLSLGSLTDAFNPVVVKLEDLIDVEKLAIDTNTTLVDAQARIVIATAEVDEALQSEIAAFGELDVALGGTGEAFAALAEVTDASLTGMEATADVAGPAIDSALGPIGIALLAVTLLLPLVLKHWKEIWKDVKDVALGAWHELDKIFNDIKSVIEKHIKEIGVILLILPFGPFILGAIELAKHWKEIWADVKEVVHVAIAVVKTELEDLDHIILRAESDAIAPFKAAWDGFSKWWSAYWPEIKEVLSEAWDVISTTISTALSIIVPIVKGAFDAIADVVKVAFELIKTIVSIFWPLISAEFKIALDIIKTTVSVALTVIGTVFKVVFGAITVVVRTAWDIISGEVKAAFAIIKGIFEVGLDLLTGHWSKAWHDFTDTIKEVGKDILGAVRSVFANLLGYVAGTIGTVLGALKKVGLAIVTGIWDGIKDAWGGLVSFLKGIPGKIEAFFKDAIHWLYDAGKSLIEGLIKGALEAPLDGLKDVGKSVLHGIKSVFHIFSPSADTQPLGASLTDGLVKGAVDRAATVAASLTPLRTAIIKCFEELQLDAYLTGSAIMANLAKGISSGLATVKAALAKLGLTFAIEANASAAAGARGGRGGHELKTELLDVAKLSDGRLLRLVDASELLGRVLVQEDTLLLSTLEIDRLHLLEARTQTQLLRDLVRLTQNPPVQTVKPQGGNSHSGTTNKRSPQASLASSIL